MANFETSNQTTLRKAKEKRIVQAQNEGYALTVGKELDTYPHGAERPGISLEIAQTVARDALRRRTQPTEEIPVVTT